MGISKRSTSKNTAFRYDGQMAIQDVETSGATTIVNDYALGVRGVDAVSRTDSTGTAVGYPIYDAHGNRTATLTKSGSSFGLVDVRSYDAWGQVRYGSQTGRPRGRYVANLGHLQDDESGLIYMRARYYEPGSGRFLTEDSRRQGQSWFSYCGNDPINRVDQSGGLWWDIESVILGLGLMVVGALALTAAWFSWPIAVACLVAGTIATIIGGAATYETLKDQAYELEFLNRPRAPGMGHGDGWAPLPIFAAIDKIKQRGNVLEKIAACQIEVLVWLVAGDL
jgi:RHS repeat-associated protein